MRCKSLPWTVFVCLVGAAVLAGCAKATVSNRENNAMNEKLPRPGNIVVYVFGATKDDVPKESGLADQHLESHLTMEDKAMAMQLGSMMATHLSNEIRKTGLPSVVGGPYTKTEPNDIVIRGYFISMEEGSAGKRVVLGFGSGGSELTTVVEGFQVTPAGLRKLGSATVDATGNKTPGIGFGAATWAITKSPVGLIVAAGTKVYGEESGNAKLEGRAEHTTEEIASVLADRFKQQGWIQ